MSKREGGTLVNFGKDGPIRLRGVSEHLKRRILKLMEREYEDGPMPPFGHYCADLMAAECARREAQLPAPSRR